MDVGVIGVGVMGKNHVRVYSELRPVSGLYVHDINHQAATSVATENGATPCSTIEELVKNVEAVSVCVPTRFHLDVARTVLPKNIHVLMEKPICATTREAEALLPLIGKGNHVRRRPYRALQPNRLRDTTYL